MIQAESMPEFMEGNALEVNLDGRPGRPVPVRVELHIEFDGGLEWVALGTEPGAGNSEHGAALGSPADRVRTIGAATAGARAIAARRAPGERKVGALLAPAGGAGLIAGPAESPPGAPLASYVQLVEPVIHLKPL